MAEAWTRHLAAQRDLPLEVASAGTLDLGPVGSPAHALDVMEGAGIDLSGHRARALAEVEMRKADLVIGFEHVHVAAAVVDGGVRYECAFKLIELVRLLETSEPGGEQGSGDRQTRIEDARRAVARAHSSRSGPDLSTAEDMPDPFGGPASAYKATSDRIAGLIGRLLGGLFVEIAGDRT